jgi:hypothetical protein
MEYAAIKKIVDLPFSLKDSLYSEGLAKLWELVCANFWWGTSQNKGYSCINVELYLVYNAFHLLSLRLLNCYILSLRQLLHLYQ